MNEQKSKKMLLTSLATLGVMVCFSHSRLSWADESNSDPVSTTHADHHKRVKRAFKLGVCVGEALAADGIKLSPGEMEKESTIDHVTKEKIKKQLRACRDEIKSVERSTLDPTTDPSTTSDTFDPEMEEEANT